MLRNAVFQLDKANVPYLLNEVLSLNAQEYINKTLNDYDTRSSMKS